jgi:DNA invertase Pin-like site-specific DNA recombinase/DNA-binding transcriptional MerR regulator
MTAFYSRLTQDDPAGKALSLPNQRKRFLELATTNGWSAHRVYEEPRRVSGELSEKERPALAQLLTDVRAGHVVRVVVRHLDRLGRGEVLETVVREFRARGVVVQTFDGPVDLSSAAGRLGVRVQAVVGAFEVERGGERVREAKRNRARDGWHLGPAPYGYTSQARVRAELTALYGSDPVGAERARTEAQLRIPISPGLVVDEAEAATVREMFRLFVHERWGARRVANHLNATGGTRRGGIWYAQTVAKVLRDPKVAGDVTYDEVAYAAKRPSSARIDRQEPFAAKHVAIIDRETWRVAKLLRENGGARWQVSREDVRAYPLSGILLCRHGHPMNGRSGGTKSRPSNCYYTCGRRARHGVEHSSGCDAPTMQAERAEAALRDVLARVLSAPEKIAAVVDEANRQLAATAPARRAEVEDLDAKVKDAQTRVKRLMALIEAEDDRDRAREVLDRVLEIRAEVLDLAEKRAELEDAPIPLPKRVSDVEVATYLEALNARLGSDPEGFSVLLVELRAHHGLAVTVVDAYTLRVALDLDPGRIGGAPVTLVSRARARGRVPLVVDAVAGTRVMSADEWASAQKGKHTCACGCGGLIDVSPRHMAESKGVPRFIQGHHRMSMTEFVEEVNAEGLLTVAQTAQLLDVGETTLRRLEERGLVQPERRAWGKREPMRLYKEAELPALREALVAAGFRFDGAGWMTTAEAAAALGISETTLRAWERSGRVPKTKRDSAGRRAFTASDVKAIRESLTGPAKGRSHSGIR